MCRLYGKIYRGKNMTIMDLVYKMIFNYVHSCDLRCGYYKQRGGLTVLRCVAKACLDYGQRVQNFIFECSDGSAIFSSKRRVRDIIDMSLDSVRFYILSKKMRIRGWK